MKRFSSSGYLFVTLLTCSLSATAQSNLDITGQLELSNTTQKVETESTTTDSFNTFTLVPSLNANYQSKTLSGFWSGKLTHLNRSRGSNDLTDNFPSYEYRLAWQPLADTIAIEASGFLKYVNANPSNFLLSDFLINSNDLVKTRSNRLSSIIAFDTGDWLNFTGSTSFSDTASEQSQFANNALNNDSLMFEGKIENGSEFNSVIFGLEGKYQETEREQVGFGDFITRTGTFFVDTNVYSNFALRLAGFHEGNQVQSDNDSSSLTRQFNSYGFGITYRQSESRFMSITLNKSDSDSVNDEEAADDSFIGLDMAWAFSPRTSVGATYGRRFFGETASAKFSYNSKYFRSSFNYSEDVTNTSRLLANQENLGVFVCPNNSFSIGDCFQPNSLNYSPAAEERLVQLNSQNIDFQDNVIVRKSGNFQAGYDFSRVTLALSTGYSEDDFLEFERLRRTFSFGSEIAFQLGSNTSINASLDFANIVEIDSNFPETREADNYNATLGIRRDLGQTLSAGLNFSFLKQEGDLITGLSQFGSDFSDRRLDFSITYIYK
jgi:uncharacterized protein (PEP-CTERM system associated)